MKSINLSILQSGPKKRLPVFLCKFQIENIPGTGLFIAITTSEVQILSILLALNIYKYFPQKSPIHPVEKKSPAAYEKSKKRLKQKQKFLSFSTKS